MNPPTILLQISLIVVAVIHLLPLFGVLGASRLATLYGIDCSEPNLQILMRHRAVLFGLLGVFLLYAAFVPHLQTLALIAGWVSVLSFLLLARQVGGYNAPLLRVVKADWLAVLMLLVGSMAYFWG